MKSFIHDDFLLESDLAQDLYHNHAKLMPIVDYHCHLPPDQIAKNHRFPSLTAIWLYGDHYKWRAMRTAGVQEKYCTGDASDWEKFSAWAATVPQTLRNPLYHWTHLELNNPFGISDRLLSPETAKSIWDECNSKLQDNQFTTQGLLKHFNVVVVCTTDDPCDDLAHHVAFAASGNSSTKMHPTWRPDKAMAVEDAVTFNQWIDKLQSAAGVSISNFSHFMDALNKRHDFFHSLGCRLSDHGLETAYAAPSSEKELTTIFAKVRSGKSLNADEILTFKSGMLYEFGLMDNAKGWVQQYHLGAMRNNNKRMLNNLGPDTGFDSIGDFEQGRPLSALLDRLDTENKLAKTILYNINPADNELMATMIGNFQDGSVAGKMQYGSGWWFLDQKSGMEKQIDALSNLGLLSRFVGMLTDSRSFLSYSRHEYFRRILCNILGDDVKKGLIPEDRTLLGTMVRDICYFNAHRYFGLEEGNPA